MRETSFRVTHGLAGAGGACRAHHHASELKRNWMGRAAPLLQGSIAASSPCERVGGETSGNLAFLLSSVCFVQRWFRT